MRSIIILMHSMCILSDSPNMPIRFQIYHFQLDQITLFYLSCEFVIRQKNNNHENAIVAATRGGFRRYRPRIKRKFVVNPRTPYPKLLCQIFLSPPFLLSGPNPAWRWFLFFLFHSSFSQGIIFRTHAEFYWFSYHLDSYVVITMAAVRLISETRFYLQDGLVYK